MKLDPNPTISVYPAPVLRETARDVEEQEIAEDVEEVAGLMLDSMYREKGVGLAAPQVELLVRLAVVDCSEERNKPLVMVNPRIVARSGKAIGVEGCLSIPGLDAKIRRAKSIVVEYVDEKGEPRRLELSDFPARVVQHELDHFDGVLMLDRMSLAARMATRSKICELEEAYGLRTRGRGKDARR